MRQSFRAVAAILIFVVLAAQQPAGAWGVEGHTWINRVAAEALPKTMPPFLRRAAGRLAYLGPEPDRWRNAVSEPQLKYSQEPDHFFNSESLPADFGPLPDGRYRFIQRLYEKRAAALQAGADKKEADELLPENVGFQPYIVMEVYGRLKAAFREYRHIKAAGQKTFGVEQNIILYAGWLGHYVADGSQPLHVTVKYDGWTGPNPSGYRTKKGIHWDYESRFVKENITPREFAPLVKTPVQLKEPFLDYQNYIKESLAQVEPLYQLEKAGALEGRGSEEARQFTRQRLAAGAQMLANLWYTAWMESAVDPPDPFAPKPAAAGLKK